MWQLPASPGTYVVDRRRRTVAAVHDSVCPIVVIHEYHSPGGLVVWVGELSAGASPAKQFVVDNQEFRRLLDHFYLPAVADPELVVALFNLCAAEYEQLIDTHRNLTNITTLLHVVVAALRTEDAPVRILDFGCGTGLAQDALQALTPSTASTIRLIGTDRSRAMLGIAAKRGLRVLSTDDWLAEPAGNIDAVIASYVFHFGISDEDIRAFARQLRHGGVLAANFHHAHGADIAALTSQMRSAGFARVELPRDVLTHPTSPILLFQLD